MIFTETPLKGSYTISIQKKEDERGFFARYFCVNEFDALGLDRNIIQINNSLSKDKYTLRGIHYQLSPYSETKIVRCVNGSIWDVIVDLRPESPTFLKWFAAELNEENRLMMYIPKGFGHAFFTLSTNAEIIYLVTQFYSQQHERGIRWNDPQIGITWPEEPNVISDRDKFHPDFNMAYHLGL